MQKVVEGPIPLRGGTDFRAWRFVLQEQSGELCDIDFEATGSALATAERCLPLRAAAAIRTSGRSEVDRLLSWPVAPERIVAGTEWITLHHRNGSWSRVGKKAAEQIADPHAKFQALIESQRIWVQLSGDLRFLFEFSGAAWSKTALRGSRLLTETERLTLTDVLAELTREAERQEALDIDPEGAALLSEEAFLVRA